MSDVFSNIRRTPFQSLSMFLIQFFSAFLLLTSVSATLFLISIFNTVETQIPVIVYFKPTSVEGDIFKLREQLMTSGKVAHIEYINKQRAFDFYKTQNKDNPLLLEMTTADNFPPSFEIQAKEPRHLFEIATFFKNKKDVDEIQFEKQTVERLMTVTNVLRIAVLSLASYLALMSIITLVTMVMFKIALRRDEIYLQKLLGTPVSSISRPFFDEGNVITILSALFAFSLFGGLLFVAKDAVNTYLFGVKTLAITYQTFTLAIWPLNTTTIAILFGSILAYIFFMGLLATKIATDKYIR